MIKILDLVVFRRESKKQNGTDITGLTYLKQNIFSLTTVSEKIFLRMQVIVAFFQL